MIINEVEYQSYKSTITSLQAQVQSLQSEKDRIIACNSRLTESNINLSDANVKLTDLVTKYQNQSLSQSPIPCVLPPKQNETKPTRSTNSIMSYFRSDANSNVESSPSPSPELVQDTKFKVNSKTVEAFVQKEGKNIFEIFEQKQDNVLTQTINLTVPNQYKLRCISCNSMFADVVNKNFKYIQGVQLQQNEFTSTAYLKSIKKGIEKHVNEVELHKISINGTDIHQKFMNHYMLK